MLYENAISWRRQERIKILVTLAKQELQKGRQTEMVLQDLDDEMINRWKLAKGTRRDYLRNIEKILKGSFSLNPYFQNNALAAKL